MPNNIEELLRRDLTENNLPRFVLTYAIGLKMYPPEYILEKYGRSYGADMDIYSYEEYENRKRELEAFLVKLNKTLANEQKLLEDVDFMYTLKMQGNKHSRSVGRYRWDLEDR